MVRKGLHKGTRLCQSSLKSLYGHEAVNADGVYFSYIDFLDSTLVLYNKSARKIDGSTYVSRETVLVNAGAEPPIRVLR